MNRLWLMQVPLALIVITVVHSAEIGDKAFCASKPDGRYPDVNGCQSFIYCFKNKTIRKHCTKGWLYDPTAEKCKKPCRTRGTLDCDVAIAGGGLSGLYMAYRLVQNSQNRSVCVFEKDSGLGGRLYDVFFDEAPKIAVALGAWRIDVGHEQMIDLVRELGLETYNLTYLKQELLESRGFFSKDKDKLLEGFPALRKSRLGRMSFAQLSVFAFKDTSQLEEYASLRSLFSDKLTPEGMAYVSEMIGSKGPFEEPLSPAAMYEFLLRVRRYTGEYVRPTGGMAAITNNLRAKLVERGVSIYTCNGVRRIDEKADGYRLYTNFQDVTAHKVVIALPPLALRDVWGTVARKLQNSPVFQSIYPMSRFKGAAMFPPGTWTRPKDYQKFTSNSDCLGLGFLYTGSGMNNEDVMQTAYTSGQCSRMWRDVQSLGKDFLDKEVHRALRYKFNRTVPRPLKTVYKYWEGALHYQRAGTKYSLTDVATWAANPLQGQSVFLVGEAYGPLRGWCEGAIDSCHDALEEGWGIRRRGKRDALKEETSSEELTGLSLRDLMLSFP